MILRRTVLYPRLLRSQWVIHRAMLTLAAFGHLNA